VTARLESLLCSSRDRTVDHKAFDIHLLRCYKRLKAFATHEHIGGRWTIDTWSRNQTCGDPFLLASRQGREHYEHGIYSSSEVHNSSNTPKAILTTSTATPTNNTPTRPRIPHPTFQILPRDPDRKGVKNQFLVEEEETSRNGHQPRLCSAQR
jgi:hypothetical protein